MSESGPAQVAIGIDVGGTKIAGGLVDVSGGGILARRTLATAAERGPGAVLDEALGLARSLIEMAGERGLQVLGIGCGVPELVDRDGNVKSSYNFAWPGVAVQARFAELAPAVVESDVRAAARAEAAFGAARALDHAVYVTIGTGVSYCLIIEGEPYAGANGYAIHFAQSPLTARCDSCGAVSRPVVEEIASGPGLAARFAARGGRAQSGEEVVAAAAEDNPLAVSVVTEAAEALGVLIGLAVNMLDPEAVIVGGGLGLAGGLYRERLAAATRAHIWADSRRDLPICSAALGADAGVIGAALTIARRARA